MADMTIGRFGTDATVTVSSIDVDGNTVNVEGWIKGSSYAEAKFERERLAGHSVDPANDVVPVTWVQDSTVDGFYRVMASGVPAGPESQQNALMRWSARLERVRGFAAPLIESYYTSALRSNAHSITSDPVTGDVIDIVGVDDAATAGNQSLDDLARTTTDGALKGFVNEGEVWDSESFTYWLPPSSWYLSASTIEYDLDGGGTWAAVAGNQLQTSDPTRVRLTNGLLRCTFQDHGFQIEIWGGSAWESSTSFDFYRDSTTAFGDGNAGDGDLSTTAVVRNTPQDVIVRVAYQQDYTNNTGRSAFVDFRLRRGFPFVQGVFKGLSTANENFGLGRTTTDAASTLTGGIEDSAADGDGNSWVVGSSKAMDDDLTNGRLTLTTAALQFDFMAGIELDSSSPAANDAAQDLIYQHHAAGTEVVRPVIRG